MFYFNEEKHCLEHLLVLLLVESDPLGQIYGWIPLLGPITRVLYLVSLYREMNSEKLKPTETALKPCQMP